MLEESVMTTSIGFAQNCATLEILELGPPGNESHRCFIISSLVVRRHDVVSLRKDDPSRNRIRRRYLLAVCWVTDAGARGRRYNIGLSADDSGPGGFLQ